MRCAARILAFSASSCLSASALAQVHVSTFDSLTEGGQGTSVVDGPLTFHEFDARFPGQSPPYVIVIDDASAQLGSFPAFSPPNLMTMTGYVPGPGAGGSRFGSATITPSGPCGAAGVDVFEFGSDAGNSVVFAAYLNGNEVARDSVVFPGGFVFHHFHLEIAGAAFDELKLYGEGPSNQGCFFGSFDNLSVTLGGGPSCYGNCDGSTTAPVLNVADFTCFLQRFAAGESYANCDESTTVPTLNVADFTCFLQRFAAGCP
jgi:hypothetical protein